MMYDKKLLKIDLADKSVVRMCKTTYGFNLTSYIWLFQRNTKLWDYVNQDIGLTYVVNDGYVEIVDYGIGVPDDIYDAIKEIESELNENMYRIKEFLK